MSKQVCNCGNCKLLGEKLLFRKYECNRDKKLTAEHYVCPYWQAKEVETPKMETFINEQPFGIDKNHIQVPNIPTEENTTDILYSMIKDIQKVNLKLTERIQKLEDTLWTKQILYSKPTAESKQDEWLKDVETKTADQMFMELGYKRISSQRLIWIIYQKESEDIDYEYDEIKINTINKLYYKEEVYKNEKEGTGITEAEDKAIHKKIEELKNA